MSQNLVSKITEAVGWVLNSSCVINKVASNEIRFNALRACRAVTVLSVLIIISSSSSNILSLIGTSFTTT